MANNKIHATCLKAMERIASYLEQSREQPEDLDDLQVRLERLEDVWSQLSTNHIKWISAKSNDVSSVEEQQAVAEELYLRTKWQIRKRMADVRRSEEQQISASESRAASQPIEVSIQMPAQQEVKNTWGDFDGSLTKWQGFRDRFIAAVHTNDQIAPAFKFQHLRRSLVGKAAQTMGEWQLTDSNYLEAWARLNELYDRKYPTCRELLKQFFSLPALPVVPRADQLQRLSNVTHETMRQLKAQGIPVDHWDMIIVHMLHERLDADTARQWELQRQSETPTAKEMLAFLDRQAAASSQPGTSQQVRASFIMSGAAARAEPRVRYDKFSNERTAQQANTARQQQHSAWAQPLIQQVTHENKPARIQHRCELCNEGHQLYRCRQFIELSQAARIRFVRMHVLCENCFKRGHSSEACFQVPCPRCPFRLMHNSLLCPNHKATLSNTVAAAKVKRKGD